MSAYTAYVKKCLNGDLPKEEQKKVGITPGDKQPTKMKKCAIGWRKKKSG